VSVDSATTINASATGRGNGGKVILWSDTETTFTGTILARGGTQGGDGGFVETSSHRLLNYSGTTDTRAPNGAVGTLLLDPFDVLISSQRTQNGSINGGTFTPTGAPSVLSKDDLNNALNLSNVIVTTGGAGSPGSQAGDITLDHGAQIIWHTGTTLTLSAYHSIIFETGSGIKNDAKGNLVLRADNSGTGSGTVSLSEGQVDFSRSTGNVSIFYNPSGPIDTKYQNPTNYSGLVLVQQPSQLTAYMLVSDATDLQNVSTNVGGTYALGRNIDAGSIANFTPIQNFTGLLDGQGQTVANLTIASTAQNVGLFGSIGSTGVVRNINLADVTVSGLGSQFVGTLAGTNAGTISNVSAIGAAVTVGSNGIAGGLVGSNSGTITNAFATGNVTGSGANSTAGGLVGQNLDTGTIAGTTVPELSQACVAGQTCASVDVNVGSNGLGGGLVGSNSGTITNAFATGDVTGAAGTTGFTTLGGLAAVNLGVVSNSFASGDVGSLNVANLQAGGLVGNNSGTILLSAALGNVQTGDTSIAGGLVALNSVGGTITSSRASGNVTVGTGSVAGSLVGANNGTISGDSTGSGTVTGIGSGTGANTVGGNPPALSASTLLPPFSPELRELLAAQQTQQIINLTSTLQLAALNTAPVVTMTQGGIRLPPQQAPGPGTGTGPGAGNQFLPPGINQRIIDIPPPNETRLKTDEVMVQIRTDIGVERLRAAVANLGVSILASEDLSILGSTAVRLHIDDGRTPAEVIRALAAVQMIAVAQPQYVYNLDQAAGAPAPSSSRGDGQPGDAAQYILQKLSLADVHRMVRGTNVPIAVIDSEIDAAHPDLEGAVTQRYDAVGAPDKPHPHGTGMAGAIGARQRLLGTAPAARLLAVHAFSTNVATPESTTFNILKGINWAVNQGVRVINMSFAGPKDPSLEHALKIAYDRNVVLIAAAGNAGPKSPPLYPGADPNVIAVTATDVDDKLFAGANRGKFVSVSAPGVDILVPAPENTYQITTGTSVAAAEVSGIVALLLERNPKLTPADVRRILQASAKRLGPGERDDNFGSGLIDPLKALQLADPRTATTTPATPTTRQR
jgi:Subtilase family/M26 IgA1-specific Metallo-endopeptidase N-terminal region